ncbi:hypothetical protein [Cuneatibacter caecimuris]|uniref:GNAT family acetyltransferase n=1 Tax=Cuneatibacter caecimuris TaxID=1796618 RepID=A0A4Q7PIQ2_9FIRM|nr:hypothetical protein [Cuneatibacter caecimuris]RZT00467.1 hypothetical protein EV209_1778 [Cuneatibacter caecimuris]
MIQVSDIMPLNFLKKSRFAGSYRGMRFLLHKVSEGAEEAQKDCLEVIVWPEPFCFEASEESDHVKASFEFSGDGIAEAVDWLNRQHRERFS